MRSHSLTDLFTELPLTAALEASPAKTSAQLDKELRLQLSQLVELKNGETYNGHLVLCDTWMNMHLREVICTSKVRRRAVSAHHSEALLSRILRILKDASLAS